MADTVKAGAKKSKTEEPRLMAARLETQKPLPLGPGARTNARIVFALALVALALWTASSFLPPLMWATVLAVSLWPLYLKFATRFMDGPSAAAAMVFTVLVALILITPISLAVYTIAQQSDMLLDWFKRAREGGIEVPDWVARLPIAAESTQQWWRANLSDPKPATAWLKSLNAENVSDLFTTFGGQLIHRLFMLFFSLLALFPEPASDGYPRSSATCCGCPAVAANESSRFRRPTPSGCMGRKPSGRTSGSDCWTIPARSGPAASRRTAAGHRSSSRRCAAGQLPRP
jgi:hypothetical protein